MRQGIKDNFVWFILTALVLFAVFIWLQVLAQATPSDKIKIKFLDVGQGSAILVSAPNNNQVLIDGGPSDAVLAKLGEALPSFDKKIELIILTHPDSDHLSGLIEVLKRYEVGQILETGINENSAEYKEWEELIGQKNIPVAFASAGQNILLADNLSIKILYPLGKINDQEFKNTNATSIVGKIIYGENEILFVGDAEEQTEKILQLTGANLSADILAVGHHGSKNSTGQEFLAAVKPKIAVIQVGLNNRYGHPAPETLEKLKNISALRNDLNGDIVFKCGPDACWQEH